MSDTYTISNDELACGLTSFGGTLTSIRDVTATEYLWTGNKTYWSGQAPILFPICGSLRNDKATIGGDKTCEMPRHGLVRKREWALESQTPTSVTFSFSSDEATLARYPFDFTLRSSYVLEGKRVSVTYEVTNDSSDVMPYCIGGHPGFRCPLFEGDSYEDYYLKFEKVENNTVPAGTSDGLVDQSRRTPFMQNTDELPLSHEMFYNDVITMDELVSHKVSLRSRKRSGGIELDFADFPYLMLWSSANDGPFVAIEPWIGLSTCSDEDNVFEHKRAVRTLSPGQSAHHSFTITIL